MDKKELLLSLYVLKFKDANHGVVPKERVDLINKITTELLSSGCEVGELFQIVDKANEIVDIAKKEGVPL